MKVELSLVPEVPPASRAAMNVDLDTKMTGQVDLEVGVVLERPSTQSASREGISGFIFVFQNTIAIVRTYL